MWDKRCWCRALNEQGRKTSTGRHSAKATSLDAVFNRHETSKERETETETEKTYENTFLLTTLQQASPAWMPLLYSQASRSSSSSGSFRGILLWMHILCNCICATALWELLTGWHCRVPPDLYRQQNLDSSVPYVCCITIRVFVWLLKVCLPAVLGSKVIRKGL